MPLARARRALRCIHARKRYALSGEITKKKPAGRKIAGKGDRVSGDSSLREPWPRQSFRRDECMCGWVRISRRTRAALTRSASSSQASCWAGDSESSLRFPDRLVRMRYLACAPVFGEFGEKAFMIVGRCREVFAYRSNSRATDFLRGEERRRNIAVPYGGRRLGMTLGNAGRRRRRHICRILPTANVAISTMA